MRRDTRTLTEYDESQEYEDDSVYDDDEDYRDLPEEDYPLDGRGRGHL